jgi:CRP-like cAMP-binding protein
VSEGEPGDAFYVLLKGLAEVTIAGRFIRNLQPGDSFGEIALFRSVQRTATVTATVESKLWMLELATFLDMLKDTLPTSLSEASSADTELAGAGTLV